MWAIGETECAKQLSIDAAGHRSGVRAVALSGDNALMLTAAEASVKVWNPRSAACLRHIDTNHGLCVMFAPGEPPCCPYIILLSEVSIDFRSTVPMVCSARDRVSCWRRAGCNSLYR